MHPYTPLQSLIDATDKAESYLERHCNHPADQWERESWAAVRRDRREIAVTEACWDRWQAHCARARSSSEFDTDDRRAQAVIEKAVSEGFPMARVDAIGNEIIEWTARQR